MASGVLVSKLSRLSDVLKEQRKAYNSDLLRDTAFVDHLEHILLSLTTLHIHSQTKNTTRLFAPFCVQASLGRASRVSSRSRADNSLHRTSRPLLGAAAEGQAESSGTQNECRPAGRREKESGTGNKLVRSSLFSGRGPSVESWSVESRKVSRNLADRFALEASALAHQQHQSPAPAAGGMAGRATGGVGRTSVLSSKLPSARNGSAFAMAGVVGRRRGAVEMSQSEVPGRLRSGEVSATLRSRLG